MPEPFVPLAVWLRAVTDESQTVSSAPETIVVEEAVSPDELCARVRRLRAAVLEALDGDPPERAALERIRSYANELLEPWPP